MLPWLIGVVAVGLGVAAVAASRDSDSGYSRSSYSDRNDRIRQAKQRDRQEKLSRFQTLISQKEASLLSKYECHIQESRRAPVVGRKKYEIARIEKSLQILDSMQADINRKLDFANNKLSHK